MNWIWKNVKNYHPSNESSNVGRQARFSGPVISVGEVVRLKIWQSKKFTKCHSNPNRIRIADSKVYDLFATRQKFSKERASDSSNSNKISWTRQKCMQSISQIHTAHSSSSSGNAEIEKRIPRLSLKMLLIWNFYSDFCAHARLLTYISVCVCFSLFLCVNVYIYHETASWRDEPSFFRRCAVKRSFLELFVSPIIRFRFVSFRLSFVRWFFGVYGCHSEWVEFHFCHCLNITETFGLSHFDMET